ncbi:tetratricopeptide repeat protein 17 isoform X2 [Neodiprion pinetum]|uniref:tetratricopeptide repeat protein 17 isoform X2 n=1 Tax=Neodiprion pinetum TaxID=441929 RepID=UPI001EDE0864|nr:tetratricopeptide repeat protein 17 isoform X2 [Neodiprion pinetum]
MMLKSTKVFLAFFEIILGISATTHWVVTENGRIQSQPDSVFQMRRPYDLVAFLEQEDRRNAVDALYRQLVARKAAIHSRCASLDSAMDVETRLYSTDPDCLLAGKPLADVDLYASVATDGSYRNGVTQKDYLLDGVPKDGKKKVPDCKKTFPLDFSMFTFEHLSAMRNRKNLTQQQEKGLIKYLPPGTDLNKFGHQVAYGLIRNSSSWLHFNLAAIYWRVRGDSYNALECGRRAIVTAPRRYRDIALLTTGGILHAAKHSGEAAIILHTAISYAPTQSHQHLALGHVYAALGDYNRSVACYDNCLRLAPTMDQARHAKHAILCHQKLEIALTSLLQQLQDILAELHAYHGQQEEWLKLQERVLWEQAPKAAFIRLQNGNIQEETLGTILTTRGQSCMQRGGNDAILTCDVTSESQMLAHNLQIDLSVSFQLLKNVENQLTKIEEQMAKSRSWHASKDRTIKSTEFPKERGPEFFTVFMEPTGRPKYHNFKIKEGTEEFENEKWPRASDCEGRLPLLTDSKQYVPAYLPPENKGYATHLFVSELIGIDPGKEHSLPWYPPACEAPKTFDAKYISTTLLKATIGNNLPDSSLSQVLKSLVKDSELAEIGQRILTATRSKVAAPWVLSMLASLHWRVVGKPRNALDCLQLALSTVPNKFRDVPLVSIASISQKVGLIEDALRVAREAIEVNPVEPITNFLYGSLLHVKGNNSGAIHHLKQTLRVDVHAINGRALTMLRTLACQEWLNNGGPDSAGSPGGTETCGAPHLPPEMITRHKLCVGEAVVCDSDGKNCKHVQCDAVRTTGDTTGSARCTRKVEKVIKHQSLIDTLMTTGNEGGADESELENMVNMEQNSFHMRISCGDDVKEPGVNVLDDFYVSMTEEGSNDAGLQIHDITGMFSLSPKGCRDMRHPPSRSFQSMWHHITARNIDISHDLKPLKDGPYQQPICEGGNPDINDVANLDALSEVLPNMTELDNAEWLALMANDQKSTVEQLGAGIAVALRKNSRSWTLATAAALYWRVDGHSRRAVDCIRQALVNAPDGMQDVPLITLASLLSKRGFHQDALRIADLALMKGPEFVINHFSMANLHTAVQVEIDEKITKKIDFHVKINFVSPQRYFYFDFLLNRVILKRL